MDLQLGKMLLDILTDTLVEQVRQTDRQTEKNRPIYLQMEKGRMDC